MKKYWLIFATFFGTTICQELKDFDEAILYGLEWPGKDYDLNYNKDKYDEMFITTHNQEKYKCMIPVTETKSESQKKIDMSKSPLQYLNPMYSKQTCSYRVEAYWTYEICHGHHVKQYHEERDGKQLKSQEYYLGKWNEVKNEELKKKIQEDIENGKKFKTTKIDSINYPYLELEMVDGTLCDLNNEPRTTKVRYVCYPHRKNEIYSIKETSSCNYEAVILTTVLCMHPAFVPEESKENAVNCIPVDEAPDKPLSWLYNEIENMKYRFKQSPTESTSPSTKPMKSVAIIKFNEKGELSINLVNNDITEQLGLLEIELNEQQAENLPTEIGQGTNPDSSSSTTRITTNPTDTTPVTEFLIGKTCLTGGTGWWKFEFCYGRFVRQFHADKTGETSLLLGIFDDELHKQWIKNNPEKRPKSKSIRNELSHFYQDGTMCDKTGDKRQTEVKLRCLQNSASPSQVSMYLLEPKTCQYTLVVESPIICDILQMADDEYGLISKDQLVLNGGLSTGREAKSSEKIYIGNVPVDGMEVRYQND